MKTILGILTAAVVVAAVPARAQGDDFAKVEIKPTKVAGSIWMLEGAGGNIGVSSGPDGLLIVDDQFLPLADKIKAALKGIAANGKLAFVVNTHWHGDHTGGNRAFGKDATIIAQSNVRKRLATPQDRGGKMSEASPKEALPIVTFEDGVTVWFNGEEIEAVHLPSGHTDGDAVIFFKNAHVVHMGDLFFNGSFPFIDRNSGGDLMGYVKNVATVLAKIPADAKIIPGHGELGTGEDLDKLAKAAGLPDEWKPWGGGYTTVDKWVEFVYTSLKP